MHVALVAAYMLVLQGLLGAFATGAAASPLVDIYGNPLCITSGHTSDAGSDGAKHSPPPDCCTTACGMFAPAAAANPAAVSLANPLSATDLELTPPYELASRSFALDRGSGSPRAPPLQV